MSPVAPPLDFGDDAVLVAALRVGDESAFAWLLDCYDGPLRRTARSFVPSAAVADEVVQETWLGVIRGIDRFQGRSSLKTWIYQILLNTARRRGVREARTVPFASAVAWAGDDYAGAFPAGRFRDRDDPWAGNWAEPPARWSPVDHVESAELLDHVRSALADLNDAQRTVMTLRDIEGWSAPEVCEVLGLTQTNQRVLLHRARARVRAALDPYLAGAEA
jgi:RNA polymerase sigma-70 factor (ECF subfamily)